MGNNIRGGKMQRIQLIALDLDGTLLNDSKEVSNESTDAVRKLISREFTLFQHPEDLQMMSFLWKSLNHWESNISLEKMAE